MDRRLLSITAALALGVLLFYGGGRAPDAPLKPAAPSAPSPPEPSPLEVARLVIVVATRGRPCPHCDRLKSDWPRGFGVPHEYLEETAEVARRYEIEGTPTLIALDAAGGEVRRQLGYEGRDALSSWLAGGQERWLCYAPAPLPRKAKAERPTLPPSCVTYWWGARFRSEFAPGGRWSCESEWGTRWVGRWALAGRTLTIEETVEGYDAWHTYRIEMAEALREGEFSAGGAFCVGAE